MFLQKLFDKLAYGEFADIAIGNSDSGTITQAAYPKVVAHINSGLLELYKRFLLKKKTVKIVQQTGVEIYYLRPEYATTLSSISPTAYIIEDDNDPFDSDLIRVLEVYDDFGDVVPLNNPRFRDTGVFTTAFDTLKMITADPPKTLSVICQVAYPEIIITEDFDPESFELNFPVFIESALLAFVAARMFKGRPAKTEGGGPAYNIYDGYFERACKKIEELGLAEDQDSDCDHFSDNGWV